METGKGRRPRTKTTPWEEIATGSWTRRKESWWLPSSANARSFNRGTTLIKHITFTKVKATADDVLIILRTLYGRAADLGIDAKTRISFYTNVLLATEGGFRPGTLGNHLRISIRNCRI
jgi:hypothetical protein